MNALSAIGLSGLQAAQTRLGASAHNIANMNTEGFRRETVVAQARDSGGVQVSTSPAAQVGVDVVQDVVEQKVAVLAFKANLQVLKTADQVLGTLLDRTA